CLRARDVTTNQTNERRDRGSEVPSYLEHSLVLRTARISGSLTRSWTGVTRPSATLMKALIIWRICCPAGVGWSVISLLAGFLSLAYLSEAADAETSRNAE